MGGGFPLILKIRTYRFKLLPYTESWVTPFRSNTGRLLRSHSYMMDYAHTLLAESPTPEGECPQLLEIRPSPPKLLHYTESSLISQANFKMGELGVGFPDHYYAAGFSR